MQKFTEVINRLPEGRYDKAGHFLTEFSINIGHNAERFARAQLCEDNPLRYGERQMASLMSVSANQMTPVHLSEMPIHRGSEGMGFIDFWANWEDTDYLMEIKSGRHRLPLPQLNKRVCNDWSLGIRQAKAIGLDRRRKATFIRPCRLTFMPIYFWQESFIEQGYDRPINGFHAFIRRISNQLEEPPHWAALYQVCPTATPLAWEHKAKVEHWPVIGFFAFVTDDIEQIMLA